MNIIDFNNKILIIKDNIKKYILNEINKEHKLLNIKLITLTELKKKYYFDYNEETIYYVSKKYNVIKDVAKIYIDNLYYIGNIDDEKINFLKELKSDLIDKKLLKENKLFKLFLKDKDIVLYNLDYIDKFYINIIDEIKDCNNVTEYIEQKNETVKTLFKAQNKEEEVSFVASKICELIKDGIDINKIKIANVQSDYAYTIDKTFKLYNIPINLPKFDTIKGTLLLNKFKELFSSNINNTLEELSKYVKTEEDKLIYNKIINIVSSYSFEKDIMNVKDYIFNDLDNIKIDDNELKNSIKCININDVILDDEYVFLINFIEGIIPTNYKDEDYLNDKLKEKLNLSTSYDLNEKSTNEIQHIIKTTKNLIITYSAYNLTSEQYISSAYNKELINIEDVIISFNHSNNYNKLKLVSEKDENKKFGTVTQTLIELLNHYKNDNYLTYDNSYTGINNIKLNNFLQNKLTLSYTSMNSYYECSFKYYLDYVLKISKREDTFEMTIGTIFHNILSKCFENDDIESLWKEEINNTTYEFSETDKFFLSKLKEELYLIIDTIKNQLKYTSLSKTMYEKEVIININENLNVKFKGFIDKILYDEFNGQTIIAIIDYKTGNPNLNINNIEHGLEMQLPVYIYLAKNDPDFKNVKIGGFYLQKILNNSTDIEERINSLKLQGYSNSDEYILEKVDNSYADSNMIKSMRMSSNGFYAYSKVISDEQIAFISNKVEDKINEASKNILDAKFDINPKEINGKNIGCSFCKYKDICYMKPKDIMKLKEIKNILEEVE